MPVAPLSSGSVLADRFEIVRVLGHGGFGIAYVANDLVRHDQVVVKELAPDGSKRRSDGFLELQCGSISAQLIRNRFAEEANRITRLNVPGVLPVRATVAENGTVYYATAYVPEAETLEQTLVRDGRFDVESAVEVFLSLLAILEAVHRQGLLHRDIKPSNVLRTPDGHVYLIDFGAAREYLADSHSTQTVMYTPGFAPPEQLSERARRGPATDLYALSATVYTLLVGRPPADAAERMSGERLVPLSEFRIDLNPEIAAAIEQGLSLAYADRPQSVAEMRALIDSIPEEQPVSDLESLDNLLYRSRTFTFQRRACPACQGVLIDPKPLRRLQCPVCHRGAIRRRAIVESACPVCRAGALRRVSNLPQLSLCPICESSPLTYRRKGLLKGKSTATCPGCKNVFEVDGSQLADPETGVSHDSAGWLAIIHRHAEFMSCRECQAQFDVLPDGRWQQMNPKPNKFAILYPDEWARVAAGLEPGAGNAECDSCGADYFLEGDRMTLLDANEDPFGFAQAFLGRNTAIEDARWLAVGKESPNAGLVCESCHTELDKDGPYLRLVRSPNRRLARLAGAPKTMEDWQRIAADLPTVDQEPALEASIVRALRTAYREGSVGFDVEGVVAWKGDAILNDESKGSLVITNRELSFGGRFRRSKTPTDAIVSVQGRSGNLYIQLAGEREADHYEIEPVELAAELQSGTRRITLDAADLAARLSTAILQ